MQYQNISLIILVAIEKVEAATSTINSILLGLLFSPTSPLVEFLESISFRQSAVSVATWEPPLISFWHTSHFALTRSCARVRLFLLLHPSVSIGDCLPHIPPSILLREPIITPVLAYSHHPYSHRFLWAIIPFLCNHFRPFDLMGAILQILCR